MTFDGPPHSGWPVMHHSSTMDWITMTIFDIHTADYVSRVVNAFATGTKTWTPGNDVCPECDATIDPYNDPYNHTVTVTPPVDGEPRVVVVIACEWYWCIDPASVGITRPGWMSANALCAGAGWTSDDDELADDTVNDGSDDNPAPLATEPVNECVVCDDPDCGPESYVDYDGTIRSTS